MKKLLLLMGSCGALAAAGDEKNFLGDWREKMHKIEPRGYLCGFAASPPVIDGKIDDAAWAAVPWTADFVDIEGDAKPPPPLRTRAKMLWDETYFYIAAEMVSPHVWATLVEHDSVIFQDPDFEVFIDPNGDSQEYYEFEMNAFNTGWDLFLPKPYITGGKADNSWEIPGLKTAVHVRGTLNDPSDEDQGWDVELAIPWKALAEFARRPSPPQEGDQWRVNFSRVDWQVTIEDGKYVKRPDVPESNWVWSPQGIIDMHRPERWGYVQFTRQPLVRPDPTRPARDALQEVFYAQKDFFTKNQRWAASLEELAFTPTPEEGVSAPVLTLTPAGFEAAALLSPPGFNPARWVIDQNANIRPEAAPATAAAPSPSAPSTERWWSDAVEASLTKAGDNHAELRKALAETPEPHRPGLRFLLENMPSVDLRSLSAAFLLDHLSMAYAAREAAPWGKTIPEDVFLNDVLPYASLNEKRDGGRRRVRELAAPLVKDCQTPGEAAQKLNREFFPLVNVKYSTRRKRPDQSSLESLESGLATCSGLSILLVDACRAVGVPARVAGTPMWTNLRGNHTWVEIWDGGWHFTGACEPDDKGLDHGWFTGDAAKARADIPRHAIYASSFKKTGLSFPLVWDRTLDWVQSVNVTDRYTGATPAAASVAEKTKMLVRVLARPGGPRVAVPVVVTDPADASFRREGLSRDETADLNNILPFDLTRDRAYRVTFGSADQQRSHDFRTGADAEQVLTLTLEEPPATETADASARALDDLRAWLALDRDQRAALDGAPFATVPLTKADAAAAQAALWEDHAKTVRETQAAAMEAGLLEIGDQQLKFETVDFPGPDGEPAGGRSLFISMHGGGNAPARVNDSQWRNQIALGRRYLPAEGVYVAPRAPTNTWNLWHESHIDPLFDRLIANLIVFKNVNPDRVYLMGYSAGGDGVYQLAPRMADRFAAASMMAGHPNEASPLGLRNLPFSIQVGEKDGAYKRNEVAAEWGRQLDALRAADPDGYEHFTDLPAGKGHWMELEDRKAIPWMEKFTRQPLPDKIVWRQDDVTHDRFYWLAVPPNQAAAGHELTATRDGGTFTLTSPNVPQAIVLLHDALTDLDQPVTIKADDRVVFQGRALRTIATLHQTLTERGDPRLVFSASVPVPLRP